jgi:hypothetical protein
MPPKKAEAGKPSKKTELKKKEKVIEVKNSDIFNNSDNNSFINVWKWEFAPVTGASYYYLIS